jgi:hypothetical protein
LRSTTTRPEGRNALSLSVAGSVVKIDRDSTRRPRHSHSLSRSIVLQLTHNSPRRPNCSLAFGRSKRPLARSRSDPETKTITHRRSPTDVLQTAHVPTRKPKHSLLLGRPQPSSEQPAPRSKDQDTDHSLAVRSASPQGPRNPCGGVRPPRTHSALGLVSLADSEPLRGSIRAASRRRLSFHDLGVTGEPSLPGLRSIEVRRKRQSSANEDLSTPLRFVASSTTSRL